ncbi:membrane-anchored lipid-binding protein Lam5p [[Candida] jaroonii]|uniref:Membrane-anchored lipid-binding protein Lam5p n=1 Tax=[Candida] jaroonii TaxID=467808 RepID=A0ACA9Y8F0_9ASCO|nr:membrane-anchored lipid-binding protein Lam5p [[Candida] jaroonii]
MNLDVERNGSSTSLVNRTRSRSNSMMKYDESGRPTGHSDTSNGSVGDHGKSLDKGLKSVKHTFDIVKDKITDKHHLHPNNIVDKQNLNTSQEKLDVEIKSIKSKEEPGILSSLLNIAHSSIIKTDKPEKSDVSTSARSETDNSTFSKNLDELIKSDGVSPNQELSPKKSTSSNNDLNSLTKSIHFASVRESPVNDMGDGDLRLDDFSNYHERHEDLYPKKSAITSDQESTTSSTSIKFASKKRNKEFHQIFKKIPKDEFLIDDFSCALSKDILVQGRMYLSQNFICFKSNILGWVTNLLIPLQEVVQIEKRSTAVLFPNGMIIRTLYQKYTFATFISRDTTFKLLTKVWHKVLMDNDQSIAFEEDDDEEEEEEEEEEEDDEKEYSDIDSETGADLNDEVNAFDDDQVGEVESIESEDAGPSKVESNTGKRSRSATESKSFNGLPIIGPSTHEATSLDYEKSSNEVLIIEDEFKAPVGVVFNLLFGKDSSYYIKILKNQKNIQIEENNITGISNNAKERNYKYVKPLTGSIGPKQTSCVINDKVIEFDLNKKVLVEQTTGTPDVPSGNAFKIRTKMFLYWGANNSTKFYVLTQIEWSGKSWIKGPIEKGSIEGQKESMKILVDSINEFLKSDNKKKKKRSPTIKKSDDESKPEPEVEAPKPLSFMDRLNELMSSIGSFVPLPIGDAIMGYIVSFIGLIILFNVYNMIFHHGKQPNIKMSSNSISIDDNKFLLIPSIENNFNKNNLMNSEINLWDWIEDKSNHKLSINNEDILKTYNHQELKEVIKLAKLKIDKLSDKLE